MASRHEIKCINKTDRYDPHERIRMVGGVNENGSNWKLEQKAAIDGIENGKWQFFVKVQGKAVDVIISTSRYGHKYLKTMADGEQPNNLLSLYECVS
jgi:hypothetical protein